MSTHIKRVAVLVDTSTGWGRRMIKGVGNFALKHDWQLTVEQRGIQERQMVKEGWQGDGVIARVSDEKLADYLRELNLPAVNVSAIQLKGESFPSIHTDEYALAEMAVKHFTQRGGPAPCLYECKPSGLYAATWTESTEDSGGAGDELPDF